MVYSEAISPEQEKVAAVGADDCYWHIYASENAKG